MRLRADQDSDRTSGPVSGAVMRLHRSPKTKGSDPAGAGNAVPMPRSGSRSGTSGPTLVLDDIAADDAKASQPGTPVGDLLARINSATPGEIARAVLDQAGSGSELVELLVELGMSDDRRVVTAIAAALGMPLANLQTTTPDPLIATMLSESLARTLVAIPIRRDEDGSIVVAICNPEPDLETQLRAALGAPVQLLLASPAEISWAIDEAYRALSGVDALVEAFTASHGKRAVMSATARSIEAVASDAPVVKVVNMIITQALRDGASDVHIEPQEEIVRVRFRVDGALHVAVELPASMGSAIASRVKIMAGMSIVERRRPQDGQIAMKVEGKAIDIRVATTGVVWGEKVVMRILDKTRALFRLADLGMVGSTYDNYRAMLNSPYGMVLCAGPTGSGKTTTLYASLNEINTPASNVTTIEDPVEYVFPSINQIQINEAAGVTFAGGLKSILRQDPDMILVGEIRDIETAKIAIQAALTGHFVLSSVHATDAVSSLYRFIDMGIEPFLISASVMGIVGQRLVRRICQDCQVEYTPSPAELAYFAQSGGTEKSVYLKGQGCNFCAHTGYSGRIGVYELLTVSAEMKELILVPGTTHKEVRELAIAQGMNTLREQGIKLVEKDQTTIAEIIRSIYTL